MTKIEVGDRLLRLRRDNRCSQGEFARRLRVSVGAYQGYERGEREVPSSLLWALHEEFGVDPLWVLAGESRESVKSPANLPSTTTTNDTPDAEGNDSSTDRPLPHGPVSRLRDVLKWVNENRHGPAITPSLIAECIGEPSATYVERLFAGNADPIFEILDRISSYIGIESAWLKHGIGTPFITRYESSIGPALADSLLSENSNKIYIVRNRQSGSIIIVVNVDDLKSRTLLTNLVMSSEIGGTGRADLASFSNTCRKFHKAGGFRVLGRQLPSSVFSEIVAGRRYPISAINQGSPSVSDSPWLEDWWDPLLFCRPSAPEYWNGFSALCADVYDHVEKSGFLRSERDKILNNNL